MLLIKLVIHAVDIARELFIHIAAHIVSEFLHI